jgi:L-iditol 2-dehydrogenase
MRVARLHGLGDLRVESVPDPVPAPGELLVRVEGCGVCPTDVRKYLIGVNDGDYPLNPGHEWVGRVEAVGADVSGWAPGDRVYGDTYAGYAELACLAVEPGAWSHGPLALPDDLPLERAVFVEPLADCLHAVRDQARLAAGESALVIGGGQMGLQLVLACALDGGRVTLAEPREDRRALGLALGAASSVGDAADLDGPFNVVVLSIGVAGLVEAAVELAAPGGRVVLFAGFGDAPRAELDLNRLHYQEIALLGSEWIGTPPNQRRERYAEARDLLVSGAAPLERLVDATCGLDGLEEAFADVRAGRRVKVLLRPDTGEPGR